MGHYFWGRDYNRIRESRDENEVGLREKLSKKLLTSKRGKRSISRKRK